MRERSEHRRPTVPLRQSHRAREMGCVGQGRLTLQISGRGTGGLVGATLARRGAAVGAVLAGASPSKNRDHRGAPACKGRAHLPGGPSFRFNCMLGGPAGC